MPDITNRKDIELIMKKFYNELLQHKDMNFIFNEVAAINLEEHLPVICDFWESIILGNHTYKKDVLSVHLKLNEKVTLKPHHFETWLTHLNIVIDQGYKGINADRMKMRAQSVATVMQTKLYRPN